MEAPGPSSLKARLVWPLSLLVAVAVIGTLGYRWLWRDIGGTTLDALFMTFTTITTIGYGEVKPLHGPGRIFTMAIATAGIGAFFYTFSVVLDHLVATGVADPRGRRRMERHIAELEWTRDRGGARTSGPSGGDGAGRRRNAARRPGPGSGGGAVRRRPGLPPPAGGCHRGRSARSGRRPARPRPHRDDGRRRHQHVHRAVGPGAQPEPAHRRAGCGRGERLEAPPGGSRPGHQPVRHRRPPPRAPDPEPCRRRLLRDGAQAGAGGPGDRGRRTPADERRGRPDARGARGAAGNGRVRARGAPRGRAHPESTGRSDDSLPATVCSPSGRATSWRGWRS